MTPITVIANGKWGTGLSWVSVREVGRTAGGGFAITYYKNNSTSETAFASVYAYGTWK